LRTESESKHSAERIKRYITVKEVRGVRGKGTQGQMEGPKAKNKGNGVLSNFKLTINKSPLNAGNEWSGKTGNKNDTVTVSGCHTTITSIRPAKRTTGGRGGERRKKKRGKNGTTCGS